MPRKPKTLVLDSWAVLAYLGSEGSGQEVADLITNAHEYRIPMYMSVVNTGEAWYNLAREMSASRADGAIADLRALGIELIYADRPITRTAGTFNERHRMSYADCFAATLATDRKSDLVTGDKEFKQVEREVSIRWV